MNTRALFLCAWILILAGFISACGDDTEETPNNSNTSETSQTTDTTGTTGTTGNTNTAGTTTTEPLPSVEDRAAGLRAPREADCDDADLSRCMLPWPSDVFVRVDETSSTKVRLDIPQEHLSPDDRPESINRADGFSRLSPILSAFPVALNAQSVGDFTEGAMRVLVSEPGDQLGEPVPLYFEVVEDNEIVGETETTLVAYPRRPLRAASEHVAVVLDDLQTADGTALERERHTAVALGLEDPKTAEEVYLYAYHAPSRQALDRAGIQLERVLRMWSFTTRSAEQPLEEVLQSRAIMLGALEDGTIGVEIDEVQLDRFEENALVVLGRLTNVPRLVPDLGGLARDEQGNVIQDGSRETPFRIAVPKGEGDYRIIMYGHGTGGTVRDSSFDREINGEGVAKVGIQFDDWTETGVLTSGGNFLNGLNGSDHTTARLVEGITMGIAVQYSLDSILGDLLAAPTIGGVENPAAGRRPTQDKVSWAGGSLGGTMGMVYASAEPSVEVAVLNVPGAGFTHYLRFSALYAFIDYLLQNNYPTKADISLAIAMSQTNFDPTDGAALVSALENKPTFLIQESIGDPILPNIGSDLVATSSEATHMGEVLHPVADLPVSTETELVGVTTFTQYDVPGDRVDDAYDVHGFAAEDTVGGNAAREQIFAFLRSYYETGQARTIIPTACLENTPANSCNFNK